MDVRRSHAVEALSSCADEGVLVSLRDGPIAGRFHAWRGASGRRYVTSVYPADRSLPNAGLPDFDAFVLIPVARTGPLRRPLDIIAVEREIDQACALTTAACEWHVHLLALSRQERAAVVADLAARHHERRAFALSA